MANKTFHGSCHCKRITFEAEIDFATAGTSKCNCTSCWKKRWWSVRAKPESFRSLGGEEHLSAYKPGEKTGHRGFCKHCGVIPYNWVDVSDWNPAQYVSVNVAALDDLDPEELMAAPLTYCNGRDNDWWHAPKETRHL